jgi:hypothetical protein
MVLKLVYLGTLVGHFAEKTLPVFIVTHVGELERFRFADGGLGPDTIDGADNEMVQVCGEASTTRVKKLDEWFIRYDGAGISEDTG